MKPEFPKRAVIRFEEGGRVGREGNGNRRTHRLIRELPR